MAFWDTIIKTTYDISLDFQDSLLPLGFLSCLGLPPCPCPPVPAHVGLALWQMTPIRAAFICSKEVTLSQKMRRLQMTPIRAAFVCSKACDIVAEDAFSVASLHSSVLFLRSASSAWQELKARYSWSFKLRLEDLKTVTFYFWTLQEDHTHHTKWPYRLEPFSSFLHVWPCRHQVNYFHACRGIAVGAGGRYVNSNLFQWEVRASLTEFLCWYIP